MTDKVILIIIALLAAACASPRRNLSLQAPTTPRLTVSDLVVHAAAPMNTPPSAPVAAKTITIEAKVEACRPLEESDPLGLYRTDAFERGQVVLTFDDGPYVDKTPPVLDMLADHGFEATFFVLGRHITAKSYAIVQRMEKEGHVIAAHSYDHDVKMAHRGASYVRGQHEVARILIEMALLATSADDFEDMHTRVFELASSRRIPNAWLSKRWQTWTERHQAILAERGFADGRYDVRYSRPPGGGPFLGTSAVPRARYAKALDGLGMLNVMWHSLSGDVDETRARNHAFLANNMKRGAARGGVLLMHDFVRPSALKEALAHIAADDSIEVVSIDEATKAKYGCLNPRRSR